MIDRYVPSRHKCFPEKQEFSDSSKKVFVSYYDGLKYYTAEIEDYFIGMDLVTFEKFYNEQNIAKKREIDILTKYDKLSAGSGEIVLRIYKEFVFYKGLYFEYAEVKRFIISQQANEVVLGVNNVVNGGDIIAYKDKQFGSSDSEMSPADRVALWRKQEKDKEDNKKRDNKKREDKEIKLEFKSESKGYREVKREVENQDSISNKQEDKPKKKSITINREAIRKITGYSPYVIPKWDREGKEIYIEWQEKLLDDDSHFVVLDKSRQVGGSYTIAELIVELSFKPNEDTLVGAFTKKTTDVIRNYVLKYIRKFSEGVFEHFKSEGYILNNKSGTKVYFRTLDNGGENARGLTLRNIIVDEAQLTEDYAFEDVLEPTISTTDGKMYLIGTASMNKGYFYNKIVEAKTGLRDLGHNLSGNLLGVKYGDISYYKLDIHSNQLISPRIKEKILLNKDKPSYQRERFCNWESGDEKLFNPDIVNEFPDLNSDGYYVITFDPAKSGKDRSAFCISYTFNGVIYIIQTGFVPNGLKNKWSSQINYYNKTILKTYGDKEHILFGVDIRGIGEGFTNEWEHTVKKSIVKVGYTSGETETIDGLNWKISKSLLITNATDLVDEGKVVIIGITNKDLLEEFEFLFEIEDKRGRKAMKSNFFDDISNSFLVNLLLVSRRGLLKRTMLEEKKENNNEFAEWTKELTGYTGPTRKKQSNIW